MINIYEYVKQLDVENGTSQRMTCPMCRSYKTFTVTNNMGSLLWNCYKASCNVKGKSRVHLSAEDIRNMREVSQLGTSFEMPEYITPRNQDIMDWCNKWGLDVDALELQYDVKEHILLHFSRRGPNLHTFSRFSVG